MAQLRTSRKSVRPGYDYPPASNRERAGLRHHLAHHLCVCGRGHDHAAPQPVMPSRAALPTISASSRHLSLTRVRPTMSPRALRPQWSIPGVGPVQPCFDRVVIVSSAPVGKLKKVLPMTALQLACHSLVLLRYRGPDPRLSSHRILAPARVLAIEIFARSWQR